MMDKLREVLIGLFPLRDKSESTRIEYSIINLALKRLEWAELSPIEKQKKRKSILESIKKYKEKDGLQEYDYENAVISFYDLGKSILQQIDMLNENSLSIKRLRVLLLLDLNEIDQSYLLKGKKLIPTMVYKKLQSELLKDKVFISEIDMLIKCVEIINNSI